MYYLMISLAALLFSLQFVFNDGFRKENGSSLNASLRFSLYGSLAGMVLLLALNGFRMDFSWFSASMALAFSIVNILAGYCSIKALETANLSVYSVFMMIGGMFLPFLYGVCTGEEMTWMKVLCFLFITLSVVMTGTFSKQSKKAFLYYIAIFILNGMGGVIASIHQSVETLCVDSESYSILTKIITAAICFVLLLCSKQKNFSISGKSFFLASGFSAVNTGGNLLLLIALLHLPSSVQFPIVTGGTIVFATAISVFRKDNVSKKELIAALIALGASVLMAL